MILYPSLECMYFKSSCMYIEPEFSQTFLIRNFCEYLNPHNVLEKKCRLCSVLNYLRIFFMSPLSNPFWFGGFSWLHIHELLALVYARAYVTLMWHIKHKFNGAECRWVLNGAENWKKMYGRCSYHMLEELHGFNSYKARDVIGIGNSMINPSIMDLVTYMHVIWVKLHDWRCKSWYQSMSHAKREIFNSNIQ